MGWSWDGLCHVGGFHSWPVGGFWGMGDGVVGGTNLSFTCSLITTTRIICFEIRFNGDNEGKSSHSDRKMETILFVSARFWCQASSCEPIYEVFNVHVCQPCSDFTPSPQICLSWSEKIEESWPRFLLQRCACPAWWTNFTLEFACFELKRSWKVNIAPRLIACPAPSIITGYRGYSQTNFEFWYEAGGANWNIETW